MKRMRSSNGAEWKTGKTGEWRRKETDRVDKRPIRTNAEKGQGGSSGLGMLQRHREDPPFAPCFHFLLFILRQDQVDIPFAWVITAIAV